MSIERVKNLSKAVPNIILHVTSPTLEYIIKGILKDRFKAHKDFIVSVDKMKDLESAKLDAYVSPIFAEKWLIHVNLDDFGRGDLSKVLQVIPANGVVVYWTSKYGVYKKLIDSDQVKNHSSYYPHYSFSRLSPQDILFLHEYEVPERFRLDKKMLNFVMKNYRYDPQAVCDLCNTLKSGSKIDTRKELIEVMGIGGNSVASATLKILKADPKDSKALNRSFKNVLKTLDDLSLSYSYSNIRKFMLSNIEGFIDIKQLQIMGIYNRINTEIPETFDAKRLARMKRFERIILEEVSLPKLLNLKICLINYDNFRSEIAVIQAVSAYYSHLKQDKNI